MTHPIINTNEPSIFVEVKTLNVAPPFVYFGEILLIGCSRTSDVDIIQMNS